MKKATLYILALALLVTVGCGGDSVADSGGKGKTLDPCALLTDAEVQAALGQATFETYSDARFDFVTCQYLGEGGANLFIQVRTDKTIADRDSFGYEDAQAFWDSFYGSIERAEREQVSETSYYIVETLGDTESPVLIEELPELGENAVFYGTQLWFFDDYAVFSISLTLGSEGETLEKERMIEVGKSILASMP